MKGSLRTEHFRKLHLKIFLTMEGLNKSYGLGNLMLTLRERLSFAFYLYFWITRNHIFDLVLASINFLKVGMIFYCFQKLKNEVSITAYSGQQLLLLSFIIFFFQRLFKGYVFCRQAEYQKTLYLIWLFVFSSTRKQNSKVWSMSCYRIIQILKNVER